MKGRSELGVKQWALTVLAIVGAACGGEGARAEPGPSGAADDVGTTVQLAFGTGSDDLGRYYRLKSVSSNLCMDVSGAATGNGTRIVQRPCGSGESQQWYFRQVTPTFEYQLSAKHSAKCLRSDSGGSGDVRMEQDLCARNGTGAFNGTLFTITRVGTATPARYTLQTISATKCVQSMNSTSGSDIVQRACDTGTAFQWILEQRSFVAPGPTTGQWGPVHSLGIVAAAAALLPNKKVLIWASWSPIRTNGAGTRDQTAFAVLDPERPQDTVVKVAAHTIHNMFCPGIGRLADGRVFVNGGDDNHTRTTSIYDPGDADDPNDDTWEPAERMSQSRWYNTSVTMSDGQVFTLAGNRHSKETGVGEIWSPVTQGWRVIPNLVVGPITQGQPARGKPQEHPRLFLAPNGKVFVAGPTVNMQWYDTAGSGTITAAGQRKDPRAGFIVDEFSQGAVTVMFDVGKILKAGGNPTYDEIMFGVEADYVASNQRSFVIDINGGTTQPSPRSLRSSGRERWRTQSCCRMGKCSCWVAGTTARTRRTTVRSCLGSSSIQPGTPGRRWRQWA